MGWDSQEGNSPRDWVAHPKEESGRKNNAGKQSLPPCVERPAKECSLAKFASKERGRSQAEAEHRKSGGFRRARVGSRDGSLKILAATPEVSA